MLPRLSFIANDIFWRWLFSTALPQLLNVVHLALVHGHNNFFNFSETFSSSRALW